MSRSPGGAALSEKGLLTPDNCVVTLINLQPQMLFGVTNFDRQRRELRCVSYASQRGVRLP